GESARIHQRVEAIHGGQSGGNLRAHRPHRTTAARGTDRERAEPEHPFRAFLGNGRVVSRRSGDSRLASIVLREGRSRAMLRADSPGTADARLASAFPKG